MINHVERISLIFDETSMLRSSLCDYSDAYILVSATITVPNTGTAANPSYKKNIIIKNCASFTNCISEINNTQIDPPGNKTLWRHRQDVSLYVPATLQVRPKWNTQRRLNGTSPRRLSGTSPRGYILERRDNVSRGRNNEVPPVRLHDVSNKTQMKHPATSQW